MSNPNEVFQTIKVSRDKVAEAATLIHKTREDLAEAQGLIEAVGESHESDGFTVNFAEALNKLGGLATSLSHYPSVINTYISRWHDARVDEIAAFDVSVPKISLEVANQNAMEALATQEVKLVGAENSDALAKAPTLVMAVQDTSGTDPIISTVFDPDTVTDQTEKHMTEHAALQELDMFLKKYIEEGTIKVHREEAESIRNSLNYISHKNLDQACTATAQDWQEYLEQSKDNQILVIPGISQSMETFKSDELVLNKVLEKMDKEIVGGRLVRTIDEVTAPPEHTRVIAIDDWIVSGDQMSTVTKTFAAQDPDSPYIARLEINLVAASPHLVKEGFTPSNNPEDQTDYDFDEPIPVKACYATRPRLHPRERNLTHTTHTTGAHSAVDFGFSVPLESMAEDLTQANRKAGKAIPPIPHPTLSRATVRESNGDD